MGQFKNKDWSIEGHPYLLYAFRKILEDAGWVYSHSGDVHNDAIYLTPTRGRHGDEDRFVMYHQKEKKHFKLPEDWNKAIEYITQVEENYREGEWVWVESSDGFQLDALVAYTQSNKETYGFDFVGDWVEQFSLPHVSNRGKIKCRATNEEVESALWKEWKRRCKQYGIHDPSYALLELHPSNHKASNPGSNSPQQYYSIHNDSCLSDCLINVNGIVYEKGKWAVPKQHIKLVFGDKPVYLGEGNTTIIATCDGVKGDINQIDRMVYWVEKLHQVPEFSSVSLKSVGGRNIHDQLHNDTEITIGCLTGTYGELKKIQKAMHKHQGIKF